MPEFFMSKPFAILICTLVIGVSGLSPAESPGASPVTFVAPEASDGDLFGASIAVESGRILVGAPSTDLERDDVGVAYLFEADEAGAVKAVARLQAGDGELADAFGASVAISGDFILVGAPRVVLSELNEGAAYVFENDGGSWRQAAKLHRDRPGRNDMAGIAVALDGQVAVIGVPGADEAGTDSGAVLVYERGSESWEKAAVLKAELAGERFGSAVAVDGGRILVGASGNVPEKASTGSAYVFESGDAGWRQVARLTPSDGVGGDAFGDAVALDGGRALVGARFADLEGSDEGAAYVFDLSERGWEQAGKLTAPEPSDRDQFGHAVALSGATALVGAPRVDDPERDTGAVWAFEPGEGGWTLRARLSPADAGAYDRFGSAVAADGETVVAGAPQDIPPNADGEVVTGTVTVFPVR